MSPASRAPRNTLTRDRVVAAAMVVADADGLTALTIRALAGSLEVKPMAIYHHVDGKESLLDLITDEVFAEIELPDPSAPWREQLAGRARSMREVLLRHPWAVGLIETRTSPVRPAALRQHDAVIGALRSAGASSTIAIRSYVLLDSFVYGFVLQEVTMPTVDPTSELATEMASLVHPDVHPHLYAAMGERLATSDYRFADDFEPGLSVVLDGIAGWLGHDALRARAGGGHLS